MALVVPSEKLACALGAVVLIRSIINCIIEKRAMQFCATTAVITRSNLASVHISLYTMYAYIHTLCMAAATRLLTQPSAIITLEWLLATLFACYMQIPPFFLFTWNCTSAAEL